MDLDLDRVPFRVSALLGSLALVAAVAAALLVPSDPRTGGTPVDRVIEKFNTLRVVVVTREQAEAEVEGYYEGLFQHSSKAVSVNALVSGQWATEWAAWESIRERDDVIDRRGDFLFFELKPDLDVPELPGRLVTNSHGMADREYPVERRPGYVRAAFVGDSMARGLGSNPGANYESLLEDYLDRVRPAGAEIGFESLNFGVQAYRITQFVEVVRDKAARFSPDVYVVVLTNLTVVRKWSDHIGQLVADGIDLRYDFLRDVVRRARLRPDDDAVTMEAKLEPYRMEILAWALATIRESAAERDAKILVLLVPTVRDPRVEREWFEGVPELLAQQDIPTLDLLDTFGGVDDLLSLRIGPGDSHPNDLGHRRLFEAILDGLRRSPELATLLAGGPVPE
ncbi:MAG TPA: SGNH/GDSL hydrolase family protein [Planctomycetota bacterium]|nr:SGNH/GDSL hydrolase family protein [Planctomycetota bacterium]